MITSIRFPAQFQDGSRDQCSISEFTLGEGPCGKTVTALDCEPTDHGFAIAQSHDDGTVKEFFYRWPQITGRIEIERSA